MKHVRSLVLPLLVAAAPAFAAQGPYVGFVAGSDIVSQSGVSDAAVIGVTGGYQVNSLFALEATATASDHDTVISSCQFTLHTAAFYGAFRSPGTTYVKGKIGLLSESGSTSSGCGGKTASDTGGSVGVGVGTMVSDGFALELEYTIVEQDIDRLSLNALLMF